MTVLQNRYVTPLGSHQMIPVDIRLITATNAGLKVLADENRFRKDLIYRINTVEIQVPPLRHRGHDIQLLAEHFLNVYAKKYNKRIDGFEADAIKKLFSYHFPGNVRELQYSIERAVIMADQASISGNDIFFPQLSNSPKKVHLTRALLVQIWKN
nr:sigma 54-interacting transcriptional regulator [Sphingobacterium sp. IITKGP-BTPF85]